MHSPIPFHCVAEKMNLDTYIDMIENRRSEKFGVVLHESEFFKML